MPSPSVSAANSPSAVSVVPGSPRSDTTHFPAVRRAGADADGDALTGADDAAATGAAGAGVPLPERQMP